MGCPKLTYYQGETPLKVVCRADVLPEKSVQRFCSVDPLAEKYYPISPYVYVANNPLKFIDPDGKRITVSSAMNGHGVEIVTFTMDIKIKNTSYLSPSKVEGYSEQIAEQISKSFSGVDIDAKVSYKTEVNLEYDNNAGSEDFYIEFVDQIVSGYKVLNASGHTEKIGDTQTNRFQILAPGKSPGSPYGTVSEESVNRTGPHEVGHGGGLRHQKAYDAKNNVDIGGGNLMYIYGRNGKYLNTEQLQDLRNRVQEQQ